MSNSNNVRAMYLVDGYSGKGHGLTGWYRHLTVEEAKRTQGTLYAIDSSGKVREVRTNGKPQAWKRSPGCELSLKYGLKECFRVGGKDMEPCEAIDRRIVVRVQQNFTPDAPADIVTDWVLEKELGALVG